MFKFIFDKIIFSLAVLLGVLLLTFVLFNVAAGDPAAPLLGKNATPQEIESLRLKLGSNLPIIYGRYIDSECFSAPNFIRKEFGHKTTDNNAAFDSRNYLLLNNGQLVIPRNFSNHLPLFMQITFKGDLEINGTNFSHSKFKNIDIPITNFDREVTLKGNAEIKKLKFSYQQKNPFNSQLGKLAGEIVSFSSEAPYVKFFDMENSIITNEPIKKIILKGMVPSLALMLPIFFGEMIISIILSLFACAFKDTLIDKAIIVCGVMLMSLSYLVLIIFFQWFFGYYCNLFPVWGYGDVRYLFLPIITGIFYGLGSGVRFYRTVFINEAHKDYLRTATAKGCSKFTIYGKHLLKNALIPIIAQASATLPFLFTGSLLLETFFGIPGLGSASIDALNNSDLQLLKALVIFSSILFVVINFISDFLYSVVDPRIKNRR